MNAKRKKDVNFKTGKRRLKALDANGDANREKAPTKLPINEIQCKCNRECKKLDIPYYRELFHKFYEIHSKDLQGTYLLGLMNIRKPQRRRARDKEKTIKKKKKTSKKGQIVEDDADKPDEKVEEVDDSTYKRQISVCYTVPTDKGTHLVVCRKTFCDIFGLSNKIVDTLTEKKKAGDLVYVDQRGKFDHRKKFNDADIQVVKDHVNSFPREVVYSNKGKPPREYLARGLNINRLYVAFKKLHPDTHITYRFYYLTFKNEFSHLKIRKSKVVAPKVKQDAVANKQYLSPRSKNNVKVASAGNNNCTTSQQPSNSQYQFVTMDFQQEAIPIPSISHASMYYS